MSGAFSSGAAQDGAAPSSYYPTEEEGPGRCGYEDVEKNDSRLAGGGLTDDEGSDDMQWVAEQLTYHLPEVISSVEATLDAAAGGPRRGVNPGPIGLLGFGMTTVMLNINNAGFCGVGTAIPGVGICFGGVVQMIAGFLELLTGNIFGGMAFCSYGAFWLSLVCIWMLPTSGTVDNLPVEPATGYYLGVYLIVWGFFSAFLLIGTVRMNIIMFLIFVTLVLLFFLLGGANMAGNARGVKAAGYEGLVCGGLALYLGFAEIVNAVWDRTLMPIGSMMQVWQWLGILKETDDESAAASEHDSKNE